MQKNSQKVERKTQSKISYHCTWLLHGKNCLTVLMMLSQTEVLLSASKPSRRPIIQCSKKKRKGEHRRAKKKFKIRKAHLSQNVVKCDASGKKSKLMCCKINAFSTRLKLIWPRYPARTPTKCPKMHFWQKAPGVNGFNLDTSTKLLCPHLIYQHQTESKGHKTVIVIIINIHSTQ